MNCPKTAVSLLLVLCFVAACGADVAPVDKEAYLVHDGGDSIAGELPITFDEVQDQWTPDFTVKDFGHKDLADMELGDALFDIGPPPGCYSRVSHAEANA